MDLWTGIRTIYDLDIFRIISSMNGNDLGLACKARAELGLCHLGPYRIRVWTPGETAVGLPIRSTASRGCRRRLVFVQV